MRQKSSKSIRVALIFGGRSGEHEISLRSAESVRRALDPAKYELVEYFIDKQGKWHPAVIAPEPHANPGIDVAFPMLHGTFGEDGTVQGLLELAELPYVGAGVLASAVAMDKPMTKPPAVGATIDIIGVISEYTPDPFMFTMTKGELPVAKPASKTPAKKGAAKKSPTK